MLTLGRYALKKKIINIERGTRNVNISIFPSIITTILSKFKLKDEEKITLLLLLLLFTIKFNSIE